MGLLDSLSDFASSDQGLGLAQGLLSARGSQGLSAGLAGMQRAKQLEQEMAMKKQFQAMQMENYASQIAQRKAAIEKQKGAQEMLRGIFGGGQAPMSQGAFDTPAVDGVGPTMPQSMQRQAQNPGLGNASIDQIAALKTLYGVDLMDAYKWVKDPLKMDAGATYQDRATGKERFMPKLGDGMTMNGGNVSLAPGYANALGQVTAATEGAKAGLDLIPVKRSDGTEVQMPRAQAVRMLSNPQQAGSQPLSQGEAGMRGAVSGDMGADPKAIAREIAATDRDLQNVSDPKSRQVLTAYRSSLESQLSRSPQSSSVLGQSQSPADAAAQEANRVRLVDTAKADVGRDSANKSDAKRFGQFTAAMDKAISLLESGPTASGAGSLIDSAAGFFGKSTKSADLASELSTISGWMTSNVPRMEGPQSDKDMINYKIMAANVGDSTKPISQRLASAQAAKELLNKYAGINGGTQPQSGASGSFDDVPKLPANPTASSLTRGQSYMLPNGKVGKWNGMTFKVE